MILSMESVTGPLRPAQKKNFRKEWFTSRLDDIC
jgi:hypothetical protein